MTTFRKHLTFTIIVEGQIELREGQLPAAVALPALSVTTAIDADWRGTAKLLRRLADEIEVRP